MKKIAVVTGGTKGIGKAVTLRFLRDGYFVYATYKHDSDAAALLEREAGALAKDLKLARFSVADREAVKKFFREIEDAHGAIDVLVNNAGISKSALLANLSSAELEEILAVNLKGTIYCTQQALRGMALRKQGSVINLSSISAGSGDPGHTAYTASKAGVEAITRSWAKEFAPFQIRVNAVAPSLIRTDMLSSVTPEWKERVLALTPLGRFGETQDVAGAIAWLASADAAFVTGQIIAVDGGLTA